MIELKLLLLLMVANGAPIIARKFLGTRFSAPIDGGARFFDGQPFLGPSKTFRGVIAAVVLATPVAMLMGWSWKTGVALALGAMLGDLISSFIKRRLGFASSKMALGIDQVPESMVPLLLLQQQLGLDWQSITIIVVVFFLAELLSSRILFMLNIRRRPY